MFAVADARELVHRALQANDWTAALLRSRPSLIHGFNDIITAGGTSVTDTLRSD